MYADGDPYPGAPRKGEASDHSLSAADDDSLADFVGQRVTPLPYGTSSDVPHFRDPEGGHILYTRRFYILTVYGWFAFMQAMNWATWAPIATNAKTVFHWSDDVIALLPNWGPLMYIPFSFLFSWLMDVKGLRPSCVLGAALVTLGAGLRVVTMHNPAATWLIHAGQICNAVAGPAAMAGGPKVSEEWFGPKERTTSTAVSTQLQVLGVGLNFLIGPMIVKSASADQISRLLWWQFLGCIPMCVGMLVYFPSHPPTPPSRSSTVVKEDFLAGIKQLATHREFWLIALSYGVTTGVYQGFGSLLEDSLASVGVKRSHADWMGFWGMMAGGFGGIVVGRFADKIHRHKLFIVVFFVLSTLCWVYFAFAVRKVVPHSLGILYGVNAAGGFLLNAMIPLFYEMVVEACHPIGEGVLASMLSNINNLACMAFLFVPLNVFGTKWINDALWVTCAVFAFLMTQVKETYKRYDMDTRSTSLRGSVSTDDTLADERDALLRSAVA